MRLSRIFTPTPLHANTTVSLPANSAHHIARVLRLSVGAALIVFDGSGGEYQAEITQCARGQVTIHVGEHLVGVPTPSLSIALAQGIARGERMDWIVQKATELGVTNIVPLLTERSVSRLDTQQAAKKQQHWQYIVIAACEQSGRCTVPEVATANTLPAYLTLPTSSTVRLLLDPAATLSLTQLPPASGPITLLIGPEGGLSPAEQAQAVQAGFMAVRLGPRILRTETAAIAALTIVQSLWGDIA